jgi:hypothetical protein
MNNSILIKQCADKPHFHDAQSSLNSSVRQKTMRLVQGRKHQLPRMVDLVVRLMEVSGGMLGGESERTVESWSKRGTWRES